MESQHMIALFASIVSILIAAVGYFLKQSLNSVKDLAEEIKKLVAIVQVHTTGIAVIESKYIRIEADIDGLKNRYDELAGFLHGHGFSRRASHGE